MDYDVIVVGLGGIGSAAARAVAARPGVRLLGLEQFTLGHDRGASQDESRIIRLAYHRREYVALARRAYDAWRALEAEAGEHVLTITGGLDIAPAGTVDSIDDYATAMAAAGVSFEWLDGAAVQRRWPAWRLDPGTRAIFQEAAGIVDPSVANAVQQRLASEHGATFVEHARVTGIRDQAGEVAVTVGDATEASSPARTYTAGAVILATDAWTNDLLQPLGSPLELRVTREQVTWFDGGAGAPTARSSAASAHRSFEPGRFPIWIWLDQPSFYGFPNHRGRGPKVGQDVGGRATTAATRTFEPDPDDLRAVSGFVERHLPGAGRPVATKTCLYTLTPDRDFVIDRLPALPSVVVALGAAHAFKFSALLGELLADLALDPARARPGSDLELFRIDRPGLIRRFS